MQRRRGRLFGCFCGIPKESDASAGFSAHHMPSSSQEAAVNQPARSMRLDAAVPEVNSPSDLEVLQSSSLGKIDYPENALLGTQHSRNDSAVSTFTKTLSATQSPDYSDANVNMPPSMITFNSLLEQEIRYLEVLAQGGYGIVYKGLWPGGLVAVKFLVADDGDSLRGSTSEAIVSRLMSHPHVVQTYGCKVQRLDEELMSMIGRQEPELMASQQDSLVRVSFNPGTRCSSMKEHGDPIDMFLCDRADTTRPVDPPIQSGDGFGALYQDGAHAGSNIQEVLRELGARPGQYVTQIVMEYCDKGVLQQVIDRGLFKPDSKWGKRLSLRALLRTAQEVAQGMRHLHSLSMVHGDLKPSNVLLKSSRGDRRGFIAKVSDFGLAQVGDICEQQGHQPAGTLTHMPPEMLTGGPRLPAADVYAFGIMLWEMYTAMQPYANMNKGMIIAGITSGWLRPEWPSDSPTWLQRLSKRCWHSDVAQRPSFERILKVLAAIEQLLRKEARQPKRASITGSSEGSCQGSLATAGLLASQDAGSDWHALLGTQDGSIVHDLTSMAAKQEGPSNKQPSAPAAHQCPGPAAVSPPLPQHCGNAASSNDAPDQRASKAPPAAPGGNHAAPRQVPSLSNTRPSLERSMFLMRESISAEARLLDGAGPGRQSTGQPASHGACPAVGSRDRHPGEAVASHLELTSICRVPDSSDPGGLDGPSKAAELRSSTRALRRSSLSIGDRPSATALATQPALHTAHVAATTSDVKTMGMIATECKMNAAERESTGTEPGSARQGASSGDRELQALAGSSISAGSGGEGPLVLVLRDGSMLEWAEKGGQQSMPPNQEPSSTRSSFTAEILDGYTATSSAENTPSFSMRNTRESLTGFIPHPEPSKRPSINAIPRAHRFSDVGHWAADLINTMNMEDMDQRDNDLGATTIFGHYSLASLWHLESRLKEQAGHTASSLDPFTTNFSFHRGSGSGTASPKSAWFQDGSCNNSAEPIPQVPGRSPQKELSNEMIWDLMGSRRRTAQQLLHACVPRRHSMTYGLQAKGLALDSQTDGPECHRLKHSVSSCDLMNLVPRSAAAQKWDALRSQIAPVDANLADGKSAGQRPLTGRGEPVDRLNGQNDPMLLPELTMLSVTDLAAELGVDSPESQDNAADMSRWPAAVGSLASAGTEMRASVPSQPGCCPDLQQQAGTSHMVPSLSAAAPCSRNTQCDEHPDGLRGSIPSAVNASPSPPSTLELVEDKQRLNMAQFWGEPRQPACGSVTAALMAVLPARLGQLLRARSMSPRAPEPRPLTQPDARIIITAAASKTAKGRRLSSAHSSDSRANPLEPASDGAVPGQPQLSSRARRTVSFSAMTGAQLQEKVVVQAAEELSGPWGLAAEVAQAALLGVLLFVLCAAAHSRCGLVLEAMRMW